MLRGVDATVDSWTRFCSKPTSSRSSSICRIREIGCWIDRWIEHTIPIHMITLPLPLHSQNHNRCYRVESVKFNILWSPSCRATGGELEARPEQGPRRYHYNGGFKRHCRAERGSRLHITRASRERVWDAWTKAEQFAVWFGGHQSRMEDMHMDVLVGGTWSGMMVLPDEGLAGKIFDAFTVTLTALGPGKTQMVVRQSGGHMSDEGYTQAEKGTGMFMDVLTEMIADA